MGVAYHAVGWALVTLHGAVADVLGPGGVDWLLALVVLSLVLRVALLPLSLRQLSVSRAVARSQPELMAARREAARAAALAREVGDLRLRARALRGVQLERARRTRDAQRRHGVRVRALLVPALVQGVVSYALLHVVRGLTPGAPARYGLSTAATRSAADARVLGAPLAAHLSSSAASVRALGGEPLATTLGAAVLVALVAVLGALGLRLSARRSLASRSEVGVAPGVRAAGGREGASEVANDQVLGLQRFVQGPGWLALGGVLLVTCSRLPIGLLVNLVVVSLWALGYSLVVNRPSQLAVLRDQVRAEEARVEAEERAVATTGAGASGADRTAGHPEGLSGSGAPAGAGAGDPGSAPPA